MRIGHELVTPVLRGLGVDGAGREFVDSSRLSRLVPTIASAWRARTCSILSAEGHELGRPAVYASTRASLIAPMWRAAFPDARWILCRRDVESSASAACADYAPRRSLDEDEKRRWMVTHARLMDEKRRWMVTHARLMDEIENGIDVDVGQLIEGDAAGMRAAFEASGLAWDEAVVADYLQPIRWKRGQFAREGAVSYGSQGDRARG
jgi:hypothetical protein